MLSSARSTERVRNGFESGVVRAMMDDSDCFEPKSSIQSKHAFVLELNREIIRDPLSSDMIMRRESCLVSEYKHAICSIVCSHTYC